jgi:pimeloyl-ACP methyl ester carboxylesterase
MEIIDRGAGPALILIPGIQGRWQYVRPAVDALAKTFRVLTFPLSGEHGSSVPFDASKGLDADIEQLFHVLDVKRLDRAVVCGVSFGGLIATRFAAEHPERVSALVLVSTPGPTWHLRPRHDFYARFPWVFGPVFFAEAPFRLRAEVAIAFPRWRDRWRFAANQLLTLFSAPLSLVRMARRGRLIPTLQIADDCPRIGLPTLIITGEQTLDHVIPAEGTSEYVRLIPGSRCTTLERTGHLGSITRPDAFADLVLKFVMSLAGETPPAFEKIA